MRIFGALLLFAYCIGTVVCDSYPTWYPWENEIPENLPVSTFPDATPSYTYTADDEGGYTKLGLKCDLAAMAKTSKIAGKASAIMCPGFEYFLNKEYGTTDPYADKVDIECKGKNYTAEQGVFYPKPVVSKEEGQKETDKQMQLVLNKDGTQGPAKYCEKDCCKYTYVLAAGVRHFWFPDKAKQEYVQMLKSGTCKEGPSYEILCHRMVKWNVNTCVNNYISASKRHLIYPCPDVYVRTYFHCKSAMIDAKGVKTTWEPDKYAYKLSTKERYSSDAYVFHSDKVCHPYSYYYPSMGKKTVSSAASSASITPTPTTPASSTPSATSTSKAAPMIMFLTTLLSSAVLLMM